MIHEGPPLTRNEKAVNLMTNFTVIFASMFEEAFEELAAKMAEMTVGMGEGIADAMSQGASVVSDGGAGAEKRIEKARPEIGPEVSGQIRQMFSGIRKEISSKMPENSPEFETYLANPAFDRGIAIVERYDFKLLPRITERLGDEELASYLVLLKSGDEAFGKMFQELGQWQESLPKPPGQD